MTRTAHVTKLRAANRELLAEGHLDAIGDFFTRNYVAHGTGPAGLRGHAGIRRWVGKLHRAFRDLQVEVEILVEGRGRVAWQRTIRATHAGDFHGFPPSGKRLVWRDMVTSRFHRGLIAEDWVITDLAEQILRARGR